MAAAPGAGSSTGHQHRHRHQDQHQHSPGHWALAPAPKELQALVLATGGEKNNPKHWHWVQGEPQIVLGIGTGQGGVQNGTEHGLQPAPALGSASVHGILLLGGSTPTPAPNGGAPSSTGHRSPASPSPPPLPAGRALRPSTSASRPLRAASCWFWGCGGAGDAAFSPKKGFCLVSLCSAACRPGLLPAHTEPLPSRSPSGPGRPWQGLHARKEIAAQMQDE